MTSRLSKIIDKYRELGIDQQIDYNKFYLYSLITHSTAIEGSTITEIENIIMFDEGLSIKGKSIIEQNMNLDLKAAYDRMLDLVKEQSPITIDRLKELSALTMRNTGTTYHTALGDFSSANGDIRLLNVSAGVGGKSYMNYSKVPAKLKEFCDTLNKNLERANKLSVDEKYNLSFDAHYNLVTIHPWADGNGRMARLVMNWIQFRLGLIPAKILKDDKEDYIKALVETRENENLDIFRNFMKETMIKNLSKEIKEYEKNVLEIKPEHNKKGIRR